MSTPKELMESAKCIHACIPPGMQSAVLVSLVNQIQENGIPSGNGTGGGNVLKFESTRVPLTVVGTLINENHGLGGIPAILMMYLECVEDDFNTQYLDGQRIDAHPVWNSTDILPNFGLWADATSIVLINSLFIPGNEFQILMPHRVNNTFVNPSAANHFEARVVAWL